MGVTLITLSGIEKDAQGAVTGGQIIFTLSSNLVDASGNIVYNAGTHHATVDPVTGLWSIVLCATKGDAGITPTGSTWAVVKHVGAGESFEFELDAALGTPQYLADLTPVANTTITYGIASIVGGTSIAASTVNGIATIDFDGDLTGYTTDAELTAEASTRASADTTLTTAISTEASTRASGDTTNATNLSTHTARTDNPHSATAAQVGAPVIAAQSWDFNFTGATDGYMRAPVAMTVALGAVQGTGTPTYAKSTAADPTVYNSATLPTALEAGAWLKVTAASVTGVFAVSIVRSA